MTTPQIGDIWQWDADNSLTEHLVLIHLIEEIPAPNKQHKIYDYRTFNLTHEKFEDVIINTTYMSHWSKLA